MYSRQGLWEVLRSEVTWKPVKVLTDNAIARLAAMVGGPAGHEAGLVGSAANLLHRAKTALVGDGAQPLRTKQSAGGDNTVDNAVDNTPATHDNKC